MRRMFTEKQIEKISQEQIQTSLNRQEYKYLYIFNTLTFNTSRNGILQFPQFLIYSSYKINYPSDNILSEIKSIINNGIYPQVCSMAFEDTLWTYVIVSLYNQEDDLVAYNAQEEESLTCTDVDSLVVDVLDLTTFEHIQIEY